ncbi:MAG TPA: hypothetical protein VNT25_08020 [Allosphingosinicella sp.]|nr:hypothetical protein [Allosphingosinicella sp.]
MRKTCLALLFAAVPLGAVSAQNMPLPQFLDKAAALEKKGALALFSGDLKRLKKEVETSASLLRQERLAAKAAGRKPAYCPPEKGSGLGSNEILAHFRSIPPAQRAQMRTIDGFRSLLVRKFPCR